MRTLPSILAVAALLVAQLSAQNPVVTDVVRLGNPVSTANKMNFLAMFDRPVSGVNLADFAPITTIPGALVESMGNNGVPIESANGTNRAANGSVSNFPTTGFTIEFFYAGGFDFGGVMFDYETGPTNSNIVRMTSAGQNSVTLWVNGAAICTGTTAVWNTSYRHIAANWDSATGVGKVFIGGALVATGTGSTGFVIPTGGAVCLASELTSNNVASGSTFTTPLHGRYDEFKIWNYARPDSEIINERLLPRTGDEPGLVLYWSFDTYEDLGIGSAGENDIRDLTGNGHSPTMGPSTMPTLVAGQNLDTSRHRVTVRVPALSCEGDVGLEVLNDGSITATTGGLPLAAGFTTGETYQFRPALVLPGTGEDFAMEPFLVNGIPGTCAAAGDTVLLHVESSGGAFNWSVPMIVGQFYFPGAHPGSSFPGLNMNSSITGPFGIFVLFDGNLSGSSFFGPFLLTPGGLDVFGTLPPGLAGLNVMFQGLALNPSAANGVFATTEGREMLLR